MQTNDLDARLAHIGIQIAISGSPERSTKTWMDLEGTLLDACYEVQKDPRLLSLLFSWIKVHGNFVITEKLMKVAKERGRQSGPSPWLSAVAAFAVHIGQHKWKRLVVKQSHLTCLHDKSLVESSIELKGSVDFLEAINVRMASGSFRVRESDVFSAEMLVLRNEQYKNRYLFGASWRADIITAIEFGLTSPTQIAKTVGCSYEPAHRIFNEYNLVKKVS